MAIEGCLKKDSLKDKERHTREVVLYVLRMLGRKKTKAMEQSMKPSCPTVGFLSGLMKY